ncbi:hypothetical protein L1987_28703 [Smallanthus sonchifolius]|uniref:Uncharacterized protein n=1 Tax=Smallanthus sonchifolius TaxID=185202 RepID=A0ACB9HXY8_9ASTR|nr:hypothetical protein L1987_28703 [Smallanthus sonchifolius]
MLQSLSLPKAVNTILITPGFDAGSAFNVADGGDACSIWRIMVADDGGGEGCILAYGAQRRRRGGFEEEDKVVGLTF